MSGAKRLLQVRLDAGEEPDAEVVLSAVHMAGRSSSASQPGAYQDPAEKLRLLLKAFHVLQDSSDHALLGAA